MNKTNLVDVVASETGLTKKDVDAVVTAKDYRMPNIKSV